MKCPYKCKKGQEAFRSQELRSAEVCLGLQQESKSID